MSVGLFVQISQKYFKTVLHYLRNVEIFKEVARKRKVSVQYFHNLLHVHLSPKSVVPAVGPDLIKVTQQTGIDPQMKVLEITELAMADVIQSESNQCQNGWKMALTRTRR
jgi:EAL domain-containing protein (putative c-di-GMP-specific phosphodiesterase class I)